MSEMTAEILDLVERERERQDEKWGVQTHRPSFWLAILMEEVGEVATEIIDSGHVDIDYENELVQVAAVAVSMIECYRRNK